MFFSFLFSSFLFFSWSLEIWKQIELKNRYKKKGEHYINVHWFLHDQEPWEEKSENIHRSTNIWVLQSAANWFRVKTPRADTIKFCQFTVPWWLKPVTLSTQKKKTVVEIQGYSHGYGQNFTSTGSVAHSGLLLLLWSLEAHIASPIPTVHIRTSQKCNSKGFNKFYQMVQHTILMIYKNVNCGIKWWAIYHSSNRRPSMPLSVDSKFFVLELFLPDEVCLGSEEPTSGEGEVLWPLEIFCAVPGLASGVRDRVGSESFPTLNVSRLLAIAPLLNDPLDLPKYVELDNCTKQGGLSYNS